MNNFITMLYIIGLGVDPKNTAPAFIKRSCKICEKNYIDTYTTIIAAEYLEWIKKELNAIPANRETLEDVKNFVEEAKDKNVCLYVYGDPYIATTHQSLRIYAAERKIQVKTIYSSSFINAIFGETGLHIYKIGFVGSLIKGDINSRNYIYKQVGAALELKKHSVIIPTGYEGDLKSLISELKQAELNFKENTFADNRFLIFISRAGTDDEEIISGTIMELFKAKTAINEPFALIVPGLLHFSEEEVLKKVLNISVFQNIKPSTIEIRAQKVIDKCKLAISNAQTEGLTKKYKDIFENAILYIQDAEVAKQTGDLATALMQASYAEGLIDALRFLGENIKWE